MGRVIFSRFGKFYDFLIVNVWAWDNRKSYEIRQLLDQCLHIQFVVIKIFPLDTIGRLL